MSARRVHSERERSQLELEFEDLVVVLVDRGAADAGRASVLLDGRLGPSAKRREVREARVVVVVRVPELAALHAGPVAVIGRVFVRERVCE